MTVRSVAVLLTLVALALASCGVETAIIGASLAAGSSAARGGISFHSNSAVATFELVGFDDMVVACRDTADLLGLELRNERLTPGERAWFYYRYTPGKKLVITVLKRTETVTSVHLRVTSPGERAMASLFVLHLARTLEERGLISP